MALCWHEVLAMWRCGDAVRLLVKLWLIVVVMKKRESVCVYMVSSGLGGVVLGNMS